jgi:hypothetical protein
VTTSNLHGVLNVWCRSERAALRATGRAGRGRSNSGVSRTPARPLAPVVHAAPHRSLCVCVCVCVSLAHSDARGDASFLLTACGATSPGQCNLPPEHVCCLYGLERPGVLSSPPLPRACRLPSHSACTSAAKRRGSVSGIGSSTR